MYAYMHISKYLHLYVCMYKDLCVFNGNAKSWGFIGNLFVSLLLMLFLQAQTYTKTISFCVCINMLACFVVAAIAVYFFTVAVTVLVKCTIVFIFYVAQRKTVCSSLCFVCCAPVNKAL